MPWPSNSEFEIVFGNASLRLKGWNVLTVAVLMVSATQLYVTSYDHAHELLDAKLHGHMESSLKRREPTILRLTKDYNALCRQIGALIRQRKAPAGAVPPQEIIREGLFKLDVDDEIWQDAGLNDDFEQPPLWLSDEGVQQGIRHLLERDRCEEEVVRLVRERRALQEWLQEEWEVNRIARGHACEFVLLHPFRLLKFCDRP